MRCPRSAPPPGRVLAGAAAAPSECEATASARPRHPSSRRRRRRSRRDSRPPGSRGRTGSARGSRGDRRVGTTTETRRSLTGPVYGQPHDGHLPGRGPDGIRLPTSDGRTVGRAGCAKRRRRGHTGEPGFPRDAAPTLRFHACRPSPRLGGARAARVDARRGPPAGDRPPARARRWLRLETPGLHLAAAAYPTLYSGIEPGEHGFYYPFQWSADEQRVRLGSGVGMPETIWERIARAGRRSIVIDPYEAPRPRVPVGSFLSGSVFVNRIVLNTQSEPSQLGARLARRRGRAPHLDEVFGRPSARGLVRSRDCLVAAPARGAAAALALIAEERCDLAWIAFPAAHIAGHQLWSLRQLPAGERDRASAAGFETGLAAVYAAIDAAVGRIVESLPADADLMLLSPVGMDANESRVELLDGMVEAVLSGGASAAGETIAERALASAGQGADGLRATAARLLPDRVSVALAARLATGRRDWGRTRAFALPADHHGYVRVNLRGREREGIVDPADLDGLLDELAEGLRSFEDVGGGPAVSSVERTQDLSPGPGRICSRTWSSPGATRPHPTSPASARRASDSCRAMASAVDARATTRLTPGPCSCRARRGSSSRSASRGCPTSRRLSAPSSASTPKGSPASPCSGPDRSAQLAASRRPDGRRAS